MFPLKMVLLLAAFGLAKGCQEKKASSSVAGSGTFTINLGSEPATINPFTAADVPAGRLHDFTFDNLLIRDLDTNDWEPAVAESWEISKDKKAFTFKLREGVVWHDGKPLTVEDVKYSFEAIFDPDMNTAHLRPYYENIKLAEILDARTIRFSVKDEYFKNFDVVAELRLVPKHYYSDKALKKEHNKKIIGSGAYKLISYEKGKRFILEQNPDWWGRKDPKYSKQWTFKRMVLRFIKEQNIVMESFKKGDLDHIPMNPDTYLNKTSGPEWGSRLFKFKIQNKAPKGYSYVAWNNSHPILKDKSVRKALGMLYNRDEAMAKFEFNLSSFSDGPIYTDSDYHSPKSNPLLFDPKGALAELSAAGWKDTDADGILDKMINGRKTPLSVTVLEPSEDYAKYITIYKEEAKKMGVEINVKIIEWNSLVKLIDERKFDAIHMAWGAGDVDIDLKQIWHSGTGAQGSNFISYKNTEVDRLIDESRRTFEKSKRIPILQKASELIASDYPYLFMFSPVTNFYAINDRIERVKDTYQYGLGFQTWQLKTP